MRSSCTASPAIRSCGGTLDVGPVVTHEFPAEAVLDAFETAADAGRSGKVLLRFTADG